MDELHFCLKGKPEKNSNQMVQIITHAKSLNCAFQINPVATEGKVFKIIGTNSQLLDLQSILKKENLPLGLFLPQTGAKALCRIQPVKKRF